MTRSPFLIDGPAGVSFSGGRTSALMLRMILDAHGGKLPADVHVTFANTGKEHPKTLDFVKEVSERWNVCVRWLEYVPNDYRKPKTFREVTYETASRNGEPFAALIGKRNYLPNVMARFCTQEMKILPMENFMRAQGYEEWGNVVGLRADEPHRVHRIKDRESERTTIYCPLYDAGITVQDVDAYWKASTFDLGVPRLLGNCDLCFLKGKEKLRRIINADPLAAEWWIGQENRIGNQFHQRYTVRQLLESLDESPILDDGQVQSVDCACTD